MESDPEGVKELRNCKTSAMQGTSGDHSSYASCSPCKSLLMQRAKHGDEFQRKPVRRGVPGDVGRGLRGDRQYETAGWEDLLFPMRVRTGILHLPYRSGRYRRLLPQTGGNHDLPAEIGDCCSNFGLVHAGYSLSNVGSISFMNVIIEEDKNVIAIYPIFLFYLFIAWFVIFI
jgi:hypothetical protein